MTAPHDTPEAVEAMDHNLRSWCVTSTNEAAAMLRRLHKRATDAERERDQWIANSRENKLIAESNLRERDELQGLLVTHEICADRIKATARADALREGLEAVKGIDTADIYSTGERHAAEEIRDFAVFLIGNLIEQPTTTTGEA